MTPESVAGPDGSGLRGAWDWFVSDRTTGESTVTMPPNLPIGIFWGATAIRLTARPEGAWQSVLRLAANGALTWWAADELLRGTSPLRRTLGAVTLTGLGAAAVRAAVLRRDGAGHT